MRVVNCPFCDATLQLSDFAPEFFRCPRCLQDIFTRRSDEVLPQRILPSGDDVGFDNRVTGGGLVLMVLLLAFGGAILFHREVFRIYPWAFAWLMILVVVMSIFVLLMPRRTIKAQRSHYDERAAEQGRVLNYQAVHPHGSMEESAERILAKIVLTIVGLLLLGIGLLLLILIKTCGISGIR